VHGAETRSTFENRESQVKRYRFSKRGAIKRGLVIGSKNMDGTGGGSTRRIPGADESELRRGKVKVHNSGTRAPLIERERGGGKVKGAGTPHRLHKG